MARKTYGRDPAGHPRDGRLRRRSERGPGADLLLGVRALRRTVLVLATLAGAAWLPAPAQAADPPIFFTICEDSHRSNDDPIVYPGRPGAAHNHTFAGAWSVDAFSTHDSLQRSGTTCDLAADTAGYWAPTLYDAKGQPIRASFFAYFMPGIHEGSPKVGGGTVTRADIKAPPAGLRILADANLRRPNETGRPLGGWHCGDTTTIDPYKIPQCEVGTVKKLQALVAFPDCWDGVNLDSPDHRSHMAYAGRTPSQARAGCPASHPVPITHLSLKVFYESYGGPGVRLSSGPPESLHADFFNAWKQDELERLVDRCINDEFRNGEPCRNPQDSTRTYTPTPNPDFPNAHSLIAPLSLTPTGPSPVRSWSGPQALDGLTEDVPFPDGLGVDDSYTLRVGYNGSPSAGDKHLMMLGSPGNHARLYVNGSSVRAQVRVNGVDGPQVSATYTTGQRHVFALERAGSTVRLLVNGQVKATNAVGPAGAHDLGAGAVGAYRSGSSFYSRAPGVFDSAEVFDQDLTGVR